jgi:RNA polymerase sigma-70 factor (ECF subfamily)
VALKVFAPAITNVGAESPDLRAFYERNFEFVHRAVARLGGPLAREMQEDLVQEVFAVAAEKLASFDGRSKETTWLYRIAANLISEERRRRKRAERLDVFRWFTTPPRGPEGDAQRTEARRIVYDILDTIAEKKRTVFVLAELEGLTGPEIAEVVGAPVETVWTRLHHARKEFLAELERRGLKEVA